MSTQLPSEEFKIYIVYWINELTLMPRFCARFYSKGLLIHPVARWVNYSTCLKSSWFSTLLFDFAERWMRTAFEYGRSFTQLLS